MGLMTRLSGSHVLSSKLLSHGCIVVRDVKFWCACDEVVSRSDKNEYKLVFVYGSRKSRFLAEKRLSLNSAHKKCKKNVDTISEC